MHCPLSETGSKPLSRFTVSPLDQNPDRGGGCEKSGLGGCTYHVRHPIGRNPETLPVKENVAEARWLSRFQPMGHFKKSIRVPPLEEKSDFPLTLDLDRGNY